MGKSWRHSLANNSIAFEKAYLSFAENILSLHPPPVSTESVEKMCAMLHWKNRKNWLEGSQGTFSFYKCLLDQLYANHGKENYLTLIGLLSNEFCFSRFNKRNGKLSNFNCPVGKNGCMKNLDSTNIRCVVHFFDTVAVIFCYSQDHRNCIMAIGLTPLDGMLPIMWEMQLGFSTIRAVDILGSASAMILYYGDNDESSFISITSGRVF